MRLLSIISIPLCVAALVSCNAKKKDKSGGPDVPIVDPTHEPGQPGDAQDLIGSWTGECKAFAEDNNSERITVVFTKNTVTFSDENFNDTDCGDAHWYTKKVVSSYIAGKPGKNGLGDLDLVAVNMSHTPYTEDEVKALNKEKPCKYDHWKINEEVDVTDLDCEKNERPINAGDKGYDIYKLTNKAKTLQFGFDPFASVEDSNRGRSPEDRPTEANAYSYSRK